MELKTLGFHNGVIEGACNSFRNELNDQISRAGAWTRYQLELVSVEAFCDYVVLGGFCFHLYVHVCSPPLKDVLTCLDVFSQTFQSMGNRRKDGRTDNLFLIGTYQWLKVICVELEVFQEKVVGRSVSLDFLASARRDLLQLSPRMLVLWDRSKERKIGRKIVPCGTKGSSEGTKQIMPSNRATRVIVDEECLSPEQRFRICGSRSNVGNSEIGLLPQLGQKAGAVEDVACEVPAVVVCPFPAARNGGVSIEGRDDGLQIEVEKTCSQTRRKKPDGGTKVLLSETGEGLSHFEKWTRAFHKFNRSSNEGDEKETRARTGGSIHDVPLSFVPGCFLPPAKKQRKDRSGVSPGGEKKP